MKILSDEDVSKIPIQLLHAPVADLVVADYLGEAVTPPRQTVSFPKGQLVFTTGGSERLAGFRAYETFQSDSRRDENQIVAVWDTESCVLRGICYGTRLGAVRTGVLGGLAVDSLVPASTRSCAVIGTGLQAETQLLAILSQRQLDDVRIFSRDQGNRRRFADRFKNSVQVKMFDHPRDAVSGAEIVVLATNSWTPVVEADWLRDCIHLTTVGPKFRAAHELPLDLFDAENLLVSDSPQQILDQGDRHMLSGSRRIDEVVHLGEVLSKGRPSLPLRSVYLSAGLSGTEVVALDAAISFLDG